MKTQNQLILIPTLSVHPNKICTYHEVHWEPRRPSNKYIRDQEDNSYRKYSHLLDSTRSAEGLISDTAKRKITKAIDYLLLFAQNKKVTSQKTGRSFTFKICFITLTLPSNQEHTDHEIKRECLNQFLIELQKYHQVKRYIWRAEKQRNGNIHFHIITDKFVHWNDIRNRWNRIINKLGYVDRYQANMREFFKDGFKVRNDLLKSWSETRQRAIYKANLETGYNNPNSTDVHSIKKVRNLTAYFVKYMTKNQIDDQKTDQTQNDYTKVEGRIWGAAQELQNIKGAQTVIDNNLEEEIKTIINRTRCKAYYSDYFTVYFVDFRELRGIKGSRIFSLFCKYLIDEFNYSYQTTARF